MKLPKRAVNILRQVQYCIRREWRLYDQGTYPTDSMTCSSPCCFSGWIAWVVGGERLFKYYMEKDGCIGTVAIAEMLDIDRDLARKLFVCWPGGIISACMRPAWAEPCTKAGAEDGAAYIDEFIAKYSGETQ
jgi:hypothetical protein